MTRTVLGQRRRLDEPVLGVAQLVAVWAAVAHVVFFFWDLIRATWIELLYPVLPEVALPYAGEFALIRIGLAVFAMAGLAAVATAGIARSLSRSARVRSSRFPSFTYGLLAVVFLASIAGAVFRGLHEATAVAWWVQMLSTASFIAYLPFSREKHVLFAPVSVLTRSAKPSRLPPPSHGAADRDEFTWRELLGGLACADCHRCEQVCAAFLRGQSSPRDLMQALQRSFEYDQNRHRLLIGSISPEQIWACDTCAACMEVCPSFNEHVPLIIEMRRRLIAQGVVPEPLHRTLDNLTTSGNAFGAPPDERGNWTRDLDFGVTDARTKPVDYLWLVGDHASWDPRAVAATQAAARVLHRAGVDFGILYGAEYNAGNDARRAGAEDVYRSLAEHNRRTFQTVHFDKILTTDPHTYNVVRNEYEWPGTPPVVLHLTELVERLLRSGRLCLRRELRGAVTYQDPCYLGRYNGISEAPRHVLRELGLDVVEMRRNRAAAACCGSGGGRIWSDPVGDGAPEARVREAASLTGVHEIAVACPKDLVTLEAALERTGLRETLRVKDIGELVDEAMQPTLATSGATSGALDSRSRRSP